MVSLSRAFTSEVCAEMALKGSVGPRRALRAALAIDAVYFELVYFALTACANPAPLDATEALPAAADGRARLLSSPAAFLRRSHPPTWRKAVGDEL